MHYATLAAIMATTNRLTYTNSEIKMAIEAVKARRARGTDLSIGDDILARDWDGVSEAAEDGVLFFHSPQMLRKRFMFVKVNAGTGFFGKQKAAFNWYMSDLARDEWMAGGVKSNWGLAVTAIGNIYRFEGYR